MLLAFERALVDVVAKVGVDINPMTGYHWTKQELTEYPHGVPGWSSSISEGMPPTRAPVRHIDMERVKAMDQSMAMVCLGHITDGLDGPPWRYPVNKAEADHLYDVAQIPCNLLALEFWRKYTNDCSNTPKNQRTELQAYITAQSRPRPSWAPFRRRVESAEQHNRKIARRRDKALPAHTTSENNDNQSSKVPLQFGSTMDHGSNPPMGEHSSAKAGKPSDLPSTTTNTPRVGLYAGSDHLSKWVDYLNIHTEIVLPGIPRGDDGSITNRLALRGMLQIAKIGCDDETGQPTIMFIREVARYITDTPYHFRPSQLLQGVLLADVSDMTPEKIREHLDFVSSDVCQFGTQCEKY